jgi:hypothetical protein
VSPAFTIQVLGACMTLGNAPFMNGLTCRDRDLLHVAQNVVVDVSFGCGIVQEFLAVCVSHHRARPSAGD